MPTPLLRAVVLPFASLPFVAPAGGVLTPPRSDAPGFVPPDGMGPGDGDPRRRRRGAIPPIVANLLLALAVLAFLADVVAILVPDLSSLATASLLPVLIVATLTAVAGLAVPVSGAQRRADVAAAACVALLACLDLLSRAFRQEGSALLAAATLSACMALVAALLATVAAMER